MDKEKKIGDVLKGMANTEKWRNKLNETQIKQVWKDKMGATINHHTKEIYFRNDKIYLQIESSSLKQELSYERGKIKDMMNGELGGDYVKEVIIR